MTDEERGWVAGIFDGEGSTAFRGWHFNKSHGKRYYAKSGYIIVKSTDEPIILRLRSVTGIGNVNGPYVGKGNRKPWWSWTVSKRAEVIALAQELMPLVCPRRQEQLRALIAKLK